MLLTFTITVLLWIYQFNCQMSTIAANVPPQASWLSLLGIETLNNNLSKNVCEYHSTCPSVKPAVSYSTKAIKDIQSTQDMWCKDRSRDNNASHSHVGWNCPFVASGKRHNHGVSMESWECAGGQRSLWPSERGDEGIGRRWESKIMIAWHPHVGGLSEVGTGACRYMVSIRSHW